jgi:hypothetical protein
MDCRETKLLKHKEIKNEHLYIEKLEDERNK